MLTYSNLFNVLLQYFCRGRERAFELVPEFDFSAVHHGSVHLFFFDLCAVLTCFFVCLFVLFSMYAFVSCCMSSFSLSLFPSALLRYCHVSFCLFVFLCHGFVILLLVFHIITSWTKEKKNYVSQRTSWSEKEDTSWKTHHLVVHGLSLAARCFQDVSLHQVGLSVSETLSLSFSLSLLFHLIYYPYFQLDCIISCHLAFQHHS